MNRSMTKRSLNPINEICPHCGRSFGVRAYDRHVEWCREKTKITAPTLSAQQHLAKERMQARTKYKAPTVRYIHYANQIVHITIIRLYKRNNEFYFRL